MFVNVETTLRELRWFNVDKSMLFQLFYIWLKMKVEFVHRRSFNVEKTALNNFASIGCTDH